MRVMPDGKKGGETRLTAQAGKMLLHLLTQIDHRGQIMAVSGYRTGEEQTRIYQKSLRENGKDFTEKYVARPGCSEHQTGLAVDLGENREEIDFIRPAFPYHGICQTFREKAPLFGFVERYSRGKETITGIAQEPWHFRYVGFPHSVIMTQGGMTLEEYVEFLKDFPIGEKTLRWETQSGTVEIGYLRVETNDGKKRELWLELPDGVPFQISGNNVDGLVVAMGGDRYAGKRGK